jgi:hypothetical protein
MSTRAPVHGLMAEFESSDALVNAARAAHQAGYRALDAYSPFPIEDLDEALEFRESLIPRLMLVGGVLGALIGYGLQYYTMALAYPLNVGGRPLNSWPAFVPVTFELSVLTAAIVGAIGMLARNGLPMPYHPVFNVSSFEAASRDKFFLVVSADDPLFERRRTEQLLRSLGAREVVDVPE